MMMTGLPLVWGERGPFDPGSRPARAYADLTQTFDFRPLDVLDAAGLARGKALFLAQPQRLAPAELAALDAWIRSGGRALILTDPMLTWPSELPPGDIRRPPPVGLLAPLLDHWGLRLEPPAEGGEVEADWEGRRVLLDSPGRLVRAGGHCAVEDGGWTALCRLGRGTARIVADADLMRDSLWTWPTADNRAVVEDWMYEAAGTLRPPPRGHWILRHDAALFFAVLAVLPGIGLLLQRRRKR
jgi:hypothetical protein